MKCMIIIPTYNEKGNIEKLVDEVFSLENEFYITVVDDNSPDGTGEIADRLAKKYERLSVIHRPKKAGLGTAYMDGFRHALSERMDYILEMDADFSHQPKYLHDMLTAIQDADLVIGSRYYEGVRVDGWSFRRLLISKLANIYAAHTIIIPIWDLTSGFKCYRRKVLESIDFKKIRSDGYSFQIEMKTYAYRLGFRIKEIPIIFRERRTEASKFSKDIAKEAFWTVFKLRAPTIDILKNLKFLLKDSS